jgi:hypothetical protein
MDMNRVLSKLSLDRYRKLASAMTSEAERKNLLHYLKTEIELRLKRRQTQPRTPAEAWK